MISQLCKKFILSILVLATSNLVFSEVPPDSNSVDSSNEIPSYTFVLRGGVWWANWLKPADTKISNTNITFIDYKVNPTTLGRAELFFSAKNTSLQLKLIKKKFEQAFDFGEGLSSDFIDKPQGVNLLSVALNIGLGKNKGIVGMYADFGNFRGVAVPTNDYKYRGMTFKKNESLYWRTKYNGISAIWFFTDGWKELVKGEPVFGLGPRRLNYKVPLSVENNNPNPTGQEDDIYDMELTALLAEARVVRSIGVSDKRAFTVAGAVGFGVLTAEAPGIQKLQGRPAFEVDFEVGYQLPLLKKTKFRMNTILGLRIIYNSMSVDEYEIEGVKYSLHTTDTFWGLFGEIAFGAIVE